MVELDAADKLTLERAKTVELSRDYKLAKELYKELINKYTNNIDLLSSLGRLYEKTEEYPLALSIYEQILSLDPSNLPALNSLGSIYRHLKQYRESISSLERGIIVDETDPQVFYNLGLTYKDLGKYAESLQCFNMVIAQNPNDVLAYNHLGSLYAMQEQYTKAVPEYLKALKIDPNHPNLHLNLAHTYEKLNEQDKALLEYESALRSKPGWLEAIDGYADLLLQKSNLSKARNILSQAVRLNPNDAQMHTKLGSVFSEQREFSSAEGEFKDALNIAPDNTDALSGLADAYESEGKIKEALSVMEKYEELSPEGVDMLRQYASILLSADKLQHAMDKIKLLWDKDSQDKHTLNLLGQYYICSGEENKAKSCFEKINKIDPSYVDHLYDGARRYTQTGQHEKAETNLKKYLEYNSDDADAISLLANSYEKQDCLDDALEMYKKLSSLDPSNKVFSKNVDRVNKAIADRSDITNTKDAFVVEEDEAEDFEPIDELIFVNSNSSNVDKASSVIAESIPDFGFESLFENDDEISPFESETLDDEIMASNSKNDSLESITPEKDALDDLFRATPVAPRGEAPAGRHQPRHEEPFADFVDEDVGATNEYDPETVDLDDGTVIDEEEKPEPKKKPSKPKQKPVPEEEIELESEPEQEEEFDVEESKEVEPEEEDFSPSFNSEPETLLSDDIAEDLEEDDSESEDNLLEVEPTEEAESLSLSNDSDFADGDGEFTVDDEIGNTEDEISEFEIDDGFAQNVPEELDDDNFTPDTVSEEELSDADENLIKADTEAANLEAEEEIPELLEEETLTSETKEPEDSSVADIDLGDLQELEEQGIPLELEGEEFDVSDEYDDIAKVEEKLAEIASNSQSIPDDLQELPSDEEFEDIFEDQVEDFLASELPEDIGLMMEEEDSLPDDIPLMLTDDDLSDNIDSVEEFEPDFEENIEEEPIVKQDYSEELSDLNAENQSSLQSNNYENRLKEALNRVLDAMSKNLATQPPSQIENLFVKLRSLVEFLPEEVKSNFLVSKEHLQLEYLIFKMRGNPGLCSLVNSLRKELDMPEAEQENETLSVNNIESVFKYLKQLVTDLPDKDVSSSIDTQIDNILNKLN